MDNVLLQPRASAFLSPFQSHIPHVHRQARFHSNCYSNSPAPLSISLTNAFSSLQLHKYNRSKRSKHIAVFCQIPARDHFIPFGKFKGKMMGTLPFTYLRWMVNDPKTDEHWSSKAEEVLEDPFYRDKMEWETLEPLNSRYVTKKSNQSMDFFRLCDRFGWDPWGNWDEIDFYRLGTSKGGRIPRLKDNPKHQEKFKLLMQQKRRKLATSGSGHSVSENMVSRNPEGNYNYGGGGDVGAKYGNDTSRLGSELERRREARRYRQRLKRDPNQTQTKVEQPPLPSTEGGRLFPGRGALLRKISEAS